MRQNSCQRRRTSGSNSGQSRHASSGVLPESSISSSRSSTWGLPAIGGPPPSSLPGSGSSPTAPALLSFPSPTSRPPGTPPAPWPGSGTACRSARCCAPAPPPGGPAAGPGRRPAPPLQHPLIAPDLRPPGRGVRMATPLDRLPAVDPTSGRLNVVVESPKGSRNKYKFDGKTGQLRLSKVLPQGMAFPADFGFIPATRGEDGDPLDVLLLADEPSFPGCVVGARLIGVLEAEQTEGGQTVRNDRLVATVETPYNPAEYRSLDEVGRQRLDEIEHFFVSYNRAEGRQFRPLARRGADRGQELLDGATRGARP